MRKDSLFNDMEPVPQRPRVKPRPVGDFYSAQIRLAVVLVLCFAVLPGALLVTVGILVLVFGHQSKDIVFGVMTVALSATLVAGIAFTFVYIKRATSLARLQTEFVQKVSHDLRTPLTSIRLFVETLQSGRLVDKDKIAECLELLGQETGRLSGLVERLLKWASMEAGKRVYNPSPVRPEHIVERALLAIEPQLAALRLEAGGGGSVTLETEIARDLPEVEVDLDAMVEAVINLLQNALRYTGPEKVVRLCLGRAEKHVELVVADNGPGIPKHEQRLIFEKFYRVVDPANPNVSGSGLGLAMVHHIVKAHAGRVEVESDVGQGAAFHVFLPCRQAAPPVGAPAVAKGDA